MKFLYPIKKLNLKPWIKYWLLKKTSGESTLKAITISTGTLKKVDKSKALSIKEYYGNTVQDGTPTPESPVEIKTISGDNIFRINDENYRLDLGGTQLFDINATPSKVGGSTTYSLNNGILNVSGNWFIGYQINVKKNTDYYISADREIISGTASGNISIYDSAVSTVIKNGGRNNFTFNSGNNTVISVVLYAGQGSAGEVNFSNIMINIGTTEKPYSPYIANPIELCKIGDYKDKIYNDNGTWKVEKNVGKVILNGTRAWSSSSAYTGYARFNCDALPETVTDNNGLNTHFIERVSQPHGGYDYLYISVNSKKIYIQIQNSIASSVSVFTTWLSNNNVTVYYVKPTPTTETITNTNLISQLNALYEFYVQSSTVSISNDSEIPFEFLLEYYGR